ncbi:MAG: hypothetical protein JSR58_06770 [Verrucomicrobia bacterium]|nr:hypothetical protein [Verrucomicrobiota bacterium]
MAGVVGLGAIGLGGALRLFTGNVSDLIEQARQAGLSLEIEAGRQAGLAIDHFSNAYGERMNETVDRLDAAAQIHLANLQAIVQTAQDRNQTQITDLTARVQQFINTLPAANLRPQVRTVSPRCVAPVADQTHFILRIQGNFPNIGRPGHAPRLVLRGNDYQPQQATVQELTYNLPRTVLGAGEERRVTLTQGELHFPHEENVLLGFGNRRIEDIFHLFIGMLPTSPGTIRVHIVSPGRPARITQQHVSQEFTQTAPEIDERTYEIAPSQGWHVVRGTARIRILQENTELGGVSNTFERDDSDRILWKVSTWVAWPGHMFLQPRTAPNGVLIPGRSGPSLRFQIVFQEYQDAAQEVNHEEEIQLHWRNSRVVELPPHARWRVVLDAFDRSHHEMAQTTMDNRFITVQATSNSLTLGTVNPATLDVQ